MGNALYPDAQWSALASIWEMYYPLTGIQEDQRRLFNRLEAGMPAFVRWLLGHRPPSLGGRSLEHVLHMPDRTPTRLRARITVWRKDPAALHRTSPTLVFATLGQARADGVLTPEDEGRLVANILTTWAIRRDVTAEWTQANPPGARVATGAGAQKTDERMFDHG